jgi:hypothetical protein
MLRVMDDEAQRRAASWLAAWDAQGTHRTATAGDEAGARWLAQEAASLAAAAAIPVEVEEFKLDRLDPIAASLEIRGARIDAVPVFDAPPTDIAGITGALGVDIAVAELSPRSVYSGEYQALRRAGGHRGFVVPCAGERPGMGLLNAEQFREPYGSPAIHIATDARATVLAAAGQGAPARLVAYSRRRQAHARNIVVSLPGSDPDLPPLVVMTPRSSWWQSTAERGGGIVCWLESLRALVETPPARPVLFTANSGHELGHLGLDDFVARRPGCEERATWVHYGANIGAAEGSLSVLSASDDLRLFAAAELGRAGQLHVVAAKTQVPSGETRDIHQKGGRYLTLVGSNPSFHLPQDRWPGAVDLAAVARTAQASVRIVRGLAGG